MRTRRRAHVRVDLSIFGWRINFDGTYVIDLKREAISGRLLSFLATNSSIPFLLKLRRRRFEVAIVLRSVVPSSSSFRDRESCSCLTLSSTFAGLFIFSCPWALFLPGLARRVGPVLVGCNMGCTITTRWCGVSRGICDAERERRGFENATTRKKALLLGIYIQHCTADTNRLPPDSVVVTLASPFL
jgi:hypothetical protein